MNDMPAKNEPGDWQSLLARWRTNGFLLIAPVLIWSFAFWPLLPAGAGGSGLVPTSFQWVEYVLRVMVFGMPLLLTISSRGWIGRVGWATYLVGLVVYVTNWSSWFEGMDSSSITFLLGPYLTPMAVFFGVAALCRSWLYAGLIVGFVAVHAILGLIRLGPY